MVQLVRSESTRAGRQIQTSPGSLRVGGGRLRSGGGGSSAPADPSGQGLGDGGGAKASWKHRPELEARMAASSTGCRTAGSREEAAHSERVRLLWERAHRVTMCGWPDDSRPKVARRPPPPPRVSMSDRHETPMSKVRSSGSRAAARSSAAYAHAAACPELMRDGVADAPI